MPVSDVVDGISRVVALDEFGIESCKDTTCICTASCVAANAVVTCNSGAVHTNNATVRMNIIFFMFIGPPYINFL